MFDFFKLGLDPEKVRTTSLAKTYPSVQWESTNEKDTEILVVHYLEALREHMEKIFKKSPNPDHAAATKQYILTTPAIWSDVARDRTLKCAKAARMELNPSISIVSEPEAAAITLLENLRTQGARNQWKIGDVFVICDAGGGYDASEFT